MFLKRFIVFCNSRAKVLFNQWLPAFGPSNNPLSLLYTLTHLKSMLRKRQFALISTLTFRPTSTSLDHANPIITLGWRRRIVPSGKISAWEFRVLGAKLIFCAETAIFVSWRLLPVKRKKVGWREHKVYGSKKLQVIYLKLTREIFLTRYYFKFFFSKLKTTE